MIVNAGYRGKVDTSVPKFTYTGTYNVREDGVVELLTSGTLVFLSPSVIDVFCVGGGAGGHNFTGTAGATACGGGGGGFTSTVLKTNVSGQYAVTIGNGGAPKNGGETTSFGSVLSAKGGAAQPGATGTNLFEGGSGGSGGGSGVISSTDSSYGYGGTDGEDGGRWTTFPGGSGQGNTTREFGEATGKLYSGGGGGGRYFHGNIPVVSMGGAGGGGTGEWAGAGSSYQAAASGVANTGGGGGGAAAPYTGSTTFHPGSGGSGICCFRRSK